MFWKSSLAQKRKDYSLYMKYCKNNFSAYLRPRFSSTWEGFIFHYTHFSPSKHFCSLVQYLHKLNFKFKHHFSKCNNLLTILFGENQKRRSFSSEAASSVHSKTSYCFEILAVNANDVDCFITKILLWGPNTTIHYSTNLIEEYLWKLTTEVT